MPEIIEKSLTGELAATITLDVPPDLEYFRGHFPALPILPGIVQIKWAVDLGAQCLGLSRQVIGLEAVKFRSAVRPGDRLALSLQFDEKTRKLRFRFESEAGVHSSGRLLLRQQA